MSTDKTDILEEKVILESSDETEVNDNNTIEKEEVAEVIEMNDDDLIDIIDITDEEEIAEEIEVNDDDLIEEEIAEVIEISPVLEIQKKLDESLKANEELTSRLRSVSEAFRKKSEDVNATKKRLERQGEYKEAKTRGDVVSSIFEPFENLKRSIKGLKEAEIEESHIQGLEMVKDEFWTSLQKLGLEEIPGEGSFFNPNIHQALTTMPVTDPNLNNIVVQVYGTGYRINDIVIKPAQVIVGMFLAPPETAKPPVEEDAELNAEPNPEKSVEEDAELNAEPNAELNAEPKDNVEKEEAPSTENDES